MKETTESLVLTIFDMSELFAVFGSILLVHGNIDAYVCLGTKINFLWFVSER